VLALTRDMGELARKRLALFRKTSDGFRLAEEDLKLRGPGQVLGTSQHGFPELRVADPLRDADLMEAAREIGVEVLDQGEREQGRENLKAWIGTHAPGVDQFLGSG
jgi:ATP-dependent DNA helicase RecG